MIAPPVSAPTVDTRRQWEARGEQLRRAAVRAAEVAQALRNRAPADEVHLMNGHDTTGGER